jgi:RpiB/LacA/LacB family sugar-phosphate isomerase
MRIAIASDHAGVALEDTAVTAVREAGHDAVVIGQASEGDDYPDVALAVACAIRTGQAQRGIVLCGSGAGVTVAANKVPLVRAALAYDTYTARQMVEHDDVNVLALGARVIGPALAADLVAAFANARFSGAARHSRRLGKVLAMEATRVQGAAADVVAKGQHLWLDGLEATALHDGRVAHWIGDCAVTGATTTVDGLAAALPTGAYDERLAEHHAEAVTGPDDLALALLLGDAVAAADLVHGVYAATVGVDGYASIDLPPELVDDVEGTVELARQLHAMGGRSNLMAKVPATRAGHAALRRLVAGGVPVHTTLVFSAEQYRATAEAFMDGIESRLRAGEDPNVASLVSVHVAPWDDATAERLPDALHNTVGLLAAQSAGQARDDVHRTERWQRLADAGAARQRLAFTDMVVRPPLPPTYYADALDRQATVLLLTPATLDAFTDRARATAVETAPEVDEQQLKEAGITLDVIATRLQHDRLRAAAASWSGILDALARATADLKTAG